MKKNIILLTTALLSLVLSTSALAQDTFTEATEMWNDLLGKYVNAEGLVSYREMLPDENLSVCIRLFEQVEFDDKWTDHKKLAYLVNVYNINTVKVVVDNGCTKGLKEINNAWDIKFITINGTMYSLNEIENTLIRPNIEEPRVHFILNCAAKSCPILLNKAYTEENMEMYLSKSAYAFINNPEMNTITKDKVEVSKIFEWYESDFRKSGGVINFINQYSSVKIESGTKLKFKEYDWSLNKLR